MGSSTGMQISKSKVSTGRWKWWVNHGPVGWTILRLQGGDHLGDAGTHDLADLVGRDHLAERGVVERFGVDDAGWFDHLAACLPTLLG